MADETVDPDLQRIRSHERRADAEYTEHPTIGEDMSGLDGRLIEVEAQLGRLVGLLETVAALRADLASIAEGVDPALVAHMAELDDTVSRHGLLLGRLLDKAGDDTAT